MEKLQTSATASVLNTPIIPQPVKDKERIESLDLLRGFAILGILLMNIVGFGLLFVDTATFEQIYSERDHANFWTHATMTILFEGKMRALFCMLFGAGIMLFSIQKIVPGKKGVTLLFYLRMLWLALFGFLHAHVLLWVGDILYFYGLFGMIVFLLRKMKPKYKAMGVPIVAVLGFILGVVFYQGIRDTRLQYLEVQPLIEAGETLTEEQEATVAAWRDVEKNFLPTPDDSAESIRKMRGSYSEVASEVRPKAWDFQTKYILMLLGDNIALMLLGMALLQWGFFSGKWTLPQYRKTMWIGYGIGIPLVIISFWHQTQTASMEQYLKELEETPISWYGLIYPVQRIFIVMAHASLVIILMKQGLLDRIKESVKAVGQMAFTNYILQTVLCTLFFHGYGLGYYHHLEYYQLFFVVIAVWAISLIISPIWLKYYRFGPLEWLWRSLSYRKLQPMRREATI